MAVVRCRPPSWPKGLSSGPSSTIGPFIAIELRRSCSHLQIGSATVAFACKRLSSGGNRHNCISLMIAAIGQRFPIRIQTFVWDRVMTSGESSVLWQSCCLLGPCSVSVQLVFSLAGRISTVTLLTRASIPLQAGCVESAGSLRQPNSFVDSHPWRHSCIVVCSVTGLLMSVYSASTS